MWKRHAAAGLLHLRTFATVSYLWMTPEMKAFYDCAEVS